MKVYTKLVRLDFVLGSMQREGDVLLIKSDPTKSMPVEVEMSAQDAVGMIKAALNPSVISFVLLLPYLYFKQKRAREGGREQSVG